MPHTPQEILRFWFGNDPSSPLQKAESWWKKDSNFDREIQEKFEEDLKRAVRGEYDSWKSSSKEYLAWIILLDQFSRNIYRNTPQSFSQDPLALAASLEGQRRGFDLALTPMERSFFYMPMMHSEDREIQKRSVEVFRRLSDQAPEDLKKNLQGGYNYAVKHAEIIFRFGRFPHRNEILGRISTPEEIEFLKQPGSSF